MKKVLVTGFQPFGGEQINPSYEAVRLVSGKLEGADIIKAELPVVFGKAIEVLEEKMLEVLPDIVICVGQAGGRYQITPERVAININDARIADNEGNTPIDEPVFEDGENAYFSTLPVKAMVQQMKAAGIPAAVSNTAGTYVCNNIMYGLLYLIEKRDEFKGIKGGFIHVPFCTEQVIEKGNVPALSREQIAKGIEIVVQAAVSVDKDVKIQGGAEH